MRYNKLIRDRIPEIIEADSHKAVTHIADDAEYWQKLKEKLLEEAEEFSQDETKKELADILEVIRAICDHKNLNMDDIEKLRRMRAEERGAFTKRIILEETIPKK
ncbi:nucleoside triphosphate pyrophosphohydrolase [Candidatus Woesearchaeota archaeon]|nr:nucleoside triphosphate pyrophosphohydrolase [Candidatus Woesearchaeota archaeon]